MKIPYPNPHTRPTVLPVYKSVVLLFPEGFWRLNIISTMKAHRQTEVGYYVCRAHRSHPFVLVRESRLMMRSELSSRGHPAVKREIGCRVWPFRERGLGQRAALFAVFRSIIKPGVLREARVLVQADSRRESVGGSSGCFG